MTETTKNHNATENLMRSIAVIKTEAGQLNLTEVETCARETETLLQFIINGDLPASELIQEVCVQATELVGSMLEEITTAVAGDHLLARSTALPVFVELVHQVIVDAVVVKASKEAKEAQTHQKNAEETLEHLSDEVKDVTTVNPFVVRAMEEKVDELTDVMHLMMEDPALRKLLTGEHKVHGSRLTQVVGELAKLSKEMHLTSASTLVVPLQELAEKTAIECKKKVEVKFNHRDLEIPRDVAAGIATPLFHIVRNSITHGIETPEERKKAGKSPHGTITVTMIRTGNILCIEIEDDGVGVNHQEIIHSAVEKGLAAEGAQLGTREVEEFLFHPGLTTGTKDAGMGLSEVKAKVEALNGVILCTPTEGHGMKFRIEIPV